MSKVQKIIVKEIYEAREGKNQNYKTLLLQSEILRSGTKSAITNMFLSNNKESSLEKRTAFQPIHQDKIAELGIKVGDDISKKLGIPMRLSVTELTTEELLALPQNERQSFQMKRNNSDDRLILVGDDGQPVWRRVQVDTLESTDKYVQHTDKVGSEEFDQDDFRNVDVTEEETVAIEEPNIEA